MFDFTEPMRQKPFLSVECLNAWVSASISIGSPRFVPVPWHSTYCNGVGRDPCQSLRLDDRLGLPRHARRQIACLARTVIVDRRRLDHGPDGIAVRNRIRETAQNDHACTAAEHGSRGAMVEGAAMAIGRKYFAVLVHVTTPVRQFDRDAAGQRHVAFAVEQALAGIVHGDERGRAGGLHVHARAMQIEQVRDPGRQEVLVVAGVTQKEHPDLIEEFLMAANVEIEIAAHSAAGEYAHRSVQRFWADVRNSRSLPMRIPETVGAAGP